MAQLARHLHRDLTDELQVLVQDALFNHGAFLSPAVFVAPFSDSPAGHREALLSIETTPTTHCRDRQKAAEYARAGVPEYWMVDLVDRVIVVHRAPLHDVHNRLLIDAARTACACAGGHRTGSTTSPRRSVAPRD